MSVALNLAVSQALRLARSIPADIIDPTVTISSSEVQALWRLAGLSQAEQADQADRIVAHWPGGWVPLSPSALGYRDVCRAVDGEPLLIVRVSPRVEVSL